MTADLPATEPRHLDPNGESYVCNCPLHTEAAQGAAPRPEIVCLDGDIFESVEAMRDHIELVHVGIDIPEYGEGAAPRAEGHAYQPDWRGLDECRAEGCGKPESAHAAPRAECDPWKEPCEVHGAAPRAEGLEWMTDFELATLKAKVVKEEQRRYRLSRPSDERVPESEPDNFDNWQDTSVLRVSRRVPESEEPVASNTEHGVVSDWRARWGEDEKP